MFVIQIRLRRVLWGAGVFAAVCAMTALGIFFVRDAAHFTNSQANSPVPVILLDAGHGGEDGGAVGIDGLVEKNLNLAITLQLDFFLRAMGYETVLTRCEDCDLHAPEASNLRERKTTDIRNRFEMMEALRDNDLFVSIHMNKFGQASAWGTQVFYSKNNPQSLVAAESIQRSAVRLLQPNNSRQVKPSTDDIYLLYHANRPAVLVECGFISNAAEAQKLQQEDYQKQLAFTIAAGIAEYYSE